MKVFKLLNSRKVTAICECGENDYLIHKINPSQLLLITNSNISIDTQCNNCKKEAN